MILSWLKAARLPSQSYILTPLVLGLSIAQAQGGNLKFEILICLAIYSLCLQLYIIFANDYADQETDALNETFTLFSGGSRVLVTGERNPKEIRNAALLSMSLCIALSLYFSLASQSFLPFVLTILSLLLLFFYSYAPVKLSYRGGGEFLQMLGVGLVLPYYSFFLCQGNSYPWELLFVLLPLNLSCGIATSLPDQPSDKISNKKTIAVSFGPLAAKLILMFCEVVSLVSIYILFPAVSQTLLLGHILLFAIIALQLLCSNGIPGKLRLSVFVFLSILFNLSVQVWLILFFFQVT
ncbi:UbiA prenyltransferase [Leptospira ryugenii]|uniref:UbiA prenyltransferase n=1 Tax=Leptospira ryugenii TaxID=1917863 RepID=A0A2P2DYF3_9LEPT|nr:prenyltransferase [Leptospira ryugenii]GBF49664.1 UbiA prenyltransferase [Leptospira ryugenii]